MVTLVSRWYPLPTPRRLRHEDAAEGSPLQVYVHGHKRSVVVRIESVRVANVRARIPRGDRIAVRGIEGHMLIECHVDRSCGSVPQPDFVPAPRRMRRVLRDGEFGCWWAASRKAVHMANSE